MGQDLFIGRGREVASLEDILLRKSDINIHGEEGIGKTTLIQNVTKDKNAIFLRPSDEDYKSFDLALKNVEGLPISVKNVLDELPDDYVIFTSNPEPYLKDGIPEDNLRWLIIGARDEMKIHPSGIPYFVGGKKFNLKAADADALMNYLSRDINKIPKDTNIYLDFNILSLLDGGNHIRYFINKMINRGNSKFLAPKSVISKYNEFDEYFIPIEPTPSDKNDNLKLVVSDRIDFREVISERLNENKTVCYITQDPKEASEVKRSFENVDIIILGGDTNNKEEGITYIPPSRIDFELSKYIRNFLNKNKENASIIFSGLEKLILNKEVPENKIAVFFSYLNKKSRILNSNVTLQMKNLNNFKGRDDLAEFTKELFPTEGEFYTISLSSVVDEHPDDWKDVFVQELNNRVGGTPIIVDDYEKIDDKSKEVIRYLLNKYGPIIVSSRNKLDGFSNYLSLEGISKEDVEKFIENDSNLEVFLKSIGLGGESGLLEKLKSIDLDSVVDAYPVSPREFLSALENKIGEKSKDRMIEILSHLSVDEYNVLKYISFSGEVKLPVIANLLSPTAYSVDVEEKVAVILDKLYNIGVIGEGGHVPSVVVNTILDNVGKHTSLVLHKRAYTAFKNISKEHKESDYAKKSIEHLLNWGTLEGELNGNLSHKLIEKEIAEVREELLKYCTLHDIKEYIPKMVDFVGASSEEAMNLKLKLVDAYNLMGDFKGASELLSKDIIPNSNGSKSARVRLAKLLLNKGKIGEFNSLITTFKDEFSEDDLRYLNSLAAIKSDNYIDAINSLSKMYRDVDDDRIALNLGIAYMGVGKMDNSERYLKEALRSEDKGVELYARYYLSFITDEDAKAITKEFSNYGMALPSGIISPFYG